METISAKIGMLAAALTLALGLSIPTAVHAKQETTTLTQQVDKPMQLAHYRGYYHRHGWRGRGYRRGWYGGYYRPYYRPYYGGYRRGGAYWGRRIYYRPGCYKRCKYSRYSGRVIRCVRRCRW